MSEGSLKFRNYRPKSKCFQETIESSGIFQKVKSKILEERIDRELLDTVSLKLERDFLQLTPPQIQIPLEREYNFDIKRDFAFATRDLELKTEEAILKLVKQTKKC